MLGLSPTQEDHSKQFVKMKNPTNMSEVRRFLGMEKVHSSPGRHEEAPQRSPRQKELVELGATPERSFCHGERSTTKSLGVQSKFGDHGCVVSVSGAYACGSSLSERSGSLPMYL